MNRYQQIQRLATITQMVMGDTQAKMAKLNGQEADLRQQLKDLKIQSAEFSSTESPAFKAGADVRWQRWVDSRRVEINLELARVLARKESVRIDLQRAFGKDQAMQSLHKKMLKR